MKASLPNMLDRKAIPRFKEQFLPRRAPVREADLFYTMETSPLKSLSNTSPPVVFVNPDCKRITGELKNNNNSLGARERAAH